MVNRTLFILCSFVLVNQQGLPQDHEKDFLSLAESVQYQGRTEYIDGGGADLDWQIKLVLGVAAIPTVHALGLLMGLQSLPVRLGFSVVASSVTLMALLLAERVVFRNWDLHENEEEIGRLQGELSRAEAGELQLSESAKTSGKTAIEQANWNGYRVDLLKNEPDVKKVKWRRKLGQWSVAEGLEATAYLGVCLTGLKLMGGL